MNTHTTPIDEVGRKGLCNDFDSLTAEINSADATTQVAVGHALNVMHSIFNKSFSNLAEFKSLSKSEQIGYLNNMTQFEEELLQRNSNEMAIGCALFKMWVGALAESDDDLADYFERELEKLSRIGDPLNTNHPN
jgi:hypothetical protein